MSQRKPRITSKARRTQIDQAEANLMCPVTTHMMRDGTVVCVDWRDRTASHVPANLLPTKELMESFSKESFAEHAYAICSDLATVSAAGQVTIVAAGLPPEFGQYMQEVVRQRRTSN